MPDLISPKFLGRPLELEKAREQAAGLALATQPARNT